MFTGLVAGKGRVTGREMRGGDLRLGIDAAVLQAPALASGESIAVNGVCLTATADDQNMHFKADVSNETLSVTTLGQLRPGDEVNLERALRVGEPLGGHLVTGHVDGVGEVLALHSDGRSWRMTVRVPQSLSRYLAAKGSVCVAGVSLTINESEGDRFSVNIVPHTMTMTTLGQMTRGTRVNIEVDIIARYLERLLAAGQSAATDIDSDLLQRLGFGKEDA